MQVVPAGDRPVSVPDLVASAEPGKGCVWPRIVESHPDWTGGIGPRLRYRMKKVLTKGTITGRQQLPKRKHR